MSNKSPGNSRPQAPKAVLDHNSQVPNANKGTSGTNIHYDKAQGHRGMQISQNRNLPAK